MPGKPKVSDSNLYQIAMYLMMPQTSTVIHAELPKRHRVDFETRYRAATNGHRLPHDRSRPPYYVMPDNKNKQGKQLRIYFSRVPPEPPLIRTLFTDRGKWWTGADDQYRINHSNLVMQLFECGFVLGMNSGQEQRITKFMKMRFPVVP